MALTGCKSFEDDKKSSIDKEKSYKQGNNKANFLSDPHSLNPYQAKSANIGDVIADINGTTYVLGTLAFKEYKSGKTYKITLPLSQHECGDTDTDNWQCTNGNQYYYTGGLYLLHGWYEDFKKDFTISGYPANFSSYGEYGGLILSKSKFENNYGFQYVPVPQLNILVDETIVSIYYSKHFSTPEENITQNDGPNFAPSLVDKKLNLSIDHQTIINLGNQYKDLFNYIKIENIY